MRLASGTALVLCLVLTAAVFWPIVTHDLVRWDDDQTIENNPHFNPPTAAGIAYYWHHPAGGLYIPLTYTMWGIAAWISRAVDAQSTGRLNPGVFHLASLLLHVGAVAVVFDVLRRLLRQAFPKSTDAAMIGPTCAGALLFALHPVQVETVAWASGAKDLLCGLLALVAIREYLLAISAGAVCPRLHYALALMAQAMAMLAKPTAVVVPLVAAGIDYWIFARPVRHILRSAAPMILLSIPCIIWSRLAQEAYASVWTPYWARPLIAADALAFYLWKLVWPARLGIIYCRTPSAVLGSGVVFWSWIIPAAVGAMAWMARRRAGWLMAGAWVSITSLLPTLGFAPFMFQIYSTVADHYLYLPMFGVALAAAGAMAQLGADNNGAKSSAAHSRRAAKVAIGYTACAFVLASLAVRSVFQSFHWGDSISLFSQAVRIAPDSAAANGGLGQSLAQAGRLHKALPYFERASVLSPHSRIAQVSAAQAYVFSNHFEQALPHAIAAVRLAQQSGDRDTAWEYLMLVRALEGVGRTDQAQAVLLEALRRQSGDRRLIDELQSLRKRASTLDSSTTQPYPVAPAK